MGIGFNEWQDVKAYVLDLVDNVYEETEYLHFVTRHNKSEVTA